MKYIAVLIYISKSPRPLYRITAHIIRAILTGIIFPDHKAQRQLAHLPSDRQVPHIAFRQGDDWPAPSPGIFPCRQPRRGIRIVHHSPDGLSDIGRLRHAGVILHAVEDLLAERRIALRELPTVRRAFSPNRVCGASRRISPTRILKARSSSASDSVKAFTAALLAV